MLIKIRFKESLTEGQINTLVMQTKASDYVSNIYSNNDILIMDVPDNIEIKEFIKSDDNIICLLPPNPLRNWMTENIIELFDWSDCTNKDIFTDEYKSDYEIRVFHVVGCFMEYRYESLIDQFKKWQDHLLVSDIESDGGYDAYKAIWESLK